MAYVEQCEANMKLTNISFCIYQPPNNTTLITGFYAARHRLIYLHSRHGNVHNISTEVVEIDQQIKVYRKEGLFKHVKGKKEFLIDSAVLVLKNEEFTHRFFCAWMNEVILFSRRDQLSFVYLEWKLNLTGFGAHPIPNVGNYFYKSGHKYPSLVSRNDSLMLKNSSW